MPNPPRNPVRAASADPNRRAMMLAAAGLFGAAAALAARRARAFSVVDADRDLERLYHSACGAASEHAKVVDDARETLRKAGRSDREIAAAEPVGCPTCGCRLSLAPQPLVR
jgi:hypothetical protein